MAKKAEAKGPITLQEIAEELNDIMQYGCNDKGELVRPKEQIDVKMKEKALLEEIKKRAASDLRPDDEQEFSEDAWNWFLDNGITPTADDDSEGGDEEEAEDNGTDEDAADEAPAPKGKGKAKEEKAAPKGKGKASADDGEEKKGIKKAMVPGGNEAYAVELAKKGADLEDFIKEYTKIYTASGKKDETYINSRAKIYFNIGYKKIGKTAPGSEKQEAPKGKAKAKEQEPEEAPKQRGRGRR